MSSLLTFGLTYCCCTSATSLCTACFGSTAPGTTGRKRSVLLLTMAIGIALAFQYSLAPALVEKEGWVWKTYRSIPGLGKRAYNGWRAGCEHVISDDQDGGEVNDAFLIQCAGNAGVYRPTFISTLFFAISAIATRFNPSLNREAWPAKYVLFCLSVFVTILLYNGPLFDGIYLWLARIGAAIFMVLQQIILIDLAYNWNEEWVERSNTNDRIEYGTGSGWLHAILGTALAFYATAFTGIGFLFHTFCDCPESKAVVWLTLIGIFFMTGVQLSGTDGSLLTSSVLSLYITYLAFSIVSKNPHASCNPHLGNSDVMGIIVGLTLTAVSLAWTGWSWSAQARLNVEGVHATRAVGSQDDNSKNDRPNLDVPFLDPDDQPAYGIALEGAGPSEGDNIASNTELWKLNVVLCLISCWVAMSLTGWGEVSDQHTAANPTAGRVNMAMIAISQWVAILLYAWTLLAPRLMPDRDFS